MKIIQSVLILLWRIWFGIIAVIGVLLVAIPLFICIPSEKLYKYTWQIIRFWGMFVFYGSGMSYQRKEFDSLEKDKQYMFISNHASLMDVPLMMTLISKHNCVFVGKAELTKYPLFGLLYRRTNILVDRSNKSSRMRVFKEAQKKVALGRSIILFPEGGVPNDESIRLDEFKDGAFAIAIANKMPIAVYTFIGLKEFFPYAYFRGRPGKVNVFLEKIIPTENLSMRDRDKLKQDCFDIVEKRLIEFENEIMK